MELSSSSLPSSHGAIGGSLCLFARSLYGGLSHFVCFRAPFAFGADFLKLVVVEMLDADERVVRCADANEFVALDLNRCAVAIVRILDKKDHQKCDDRRACVDDELPGIRVLKQGSSYCHTSKTPAATMNADAWPAA